MCERCVLAAIGQPPVPPKLCDRMVDAVDVLDTVPGETAACCQLPAVAMRNGELVCVFHWLTDGAAPAPMWPFGRVQGRVAPPKMVLTA